MASPSYSTLNASTFLDYSGYQIADSAAFAALGALASTGLSQGDLTQVQSILTQTFAGSATTYTEMKDHQVVDPGYPFMAVADLTTGLGTGSLPFALDGQTITVALMVKRDADPAVLLSQDWATRQAALADQTAIWNTYGAKGRYGEVVAGLEQVLGPQAAADGPFMDAASGITSSADSRTVWLNLTPQQFQALFNTDLLVFQGASALNGEYQNYAWSGSLSLPSSIATKVSGIWVAESQPYGSPTPLDSTPVSLASGWQSPGNALVGNGASPTPTQVAQAYNFPLIDKNVATPAVALVEGGIPVFTVTPESGVSTLQAALNLYRTTVLNLPAYGANQFNIIAPASAGTGDTSEETLDVSVVAGAAPNSKQLYYVSGAGTLATYQNAIFDTVNHAPVLSSSFTDTQRFSPGSPFATAYKEVFVDAALKNISVFLSSGDGGSGGEYGTGLPIGRPSHASPYAVIVGGTSISTLQIASQDSTLTGLYQSAIANTPATLLALTAAGLTALPQNLSTSTFEVLVQSVWNTYGIGTAQAGTMSPSYLGNNASTGGIDAGTRVPSYQVDFGLNPTSAAPGSQVGRGLPDVSALAGGNAKYDVLNADYFNTLGAPLTTSAAGTSAASPLWASLTAQLDAVFADQGLPHLGYFNDLLYMADAIAPGSFSDVTLGNNTSTYYMYNGSNGASQYVLLENNKNSSASIIATGLGYAATAGYDQATGLGAPNGLLLARALTTIAHLQTGHQAEPDVVTAVSETVAQSSIGQSLLVQASGTLGAFELDAGRHAYQGAGNADALAWTDRLAQQVMQSDFDPALVRLLDGAGQAIPMTVHANAGDTLTSSVAGFALGLYQTDQTASYGFASFGGLASGVTVARPVAVAETVGDANDQSAVVRVRQNGADATSLMLYKVDDLSGHIDGVAPGDPAYAAKAAARALLFADGSAQLSSPGYGNYTEAEVHHVNHGDLIAMALTNGGQTYWGFADANETTGGAPVTHLWSYGLNTFGFEDTYGGGDHDYNDLIVLLDFTSLSGHGWIA